MASGLRPRAAEDDEATPETDEDVWLINGFMVRVGGERPPVRGTDICRFSNGASMFSEAWWCPTREEGGGGDTAAVLEDGVKSGCLSIAAALIVSVLGDDA